MQREGRAQGERIIRGLLPPMPQLNALVDTILRVKDEAEAQADPMRSVASLVREQAALSAMVDAKVDKLRTELVSKIDELGQRQLDAIRVAVASPSRASQLPGAQPLSC